MVYLKRATTKENTMNRVFVCIGRFAWGKGVSADIAKKNCRKIGGASAMAAFTVYSLPEGVNWNVDDVSGGLWVAQSGVTEIVEKKVIPAPSP